MITSLLLGATMAVAPTPAKVTSASLFKNGFAVVVREASLANGETIIENIPMATLGTLWITASPGVKLRQVTATQHETKKDVDAQSLDQVIAANVGKTVRLQISDTAVIMGKILSAAGNIVVLETETGTTVIQKASVKSIFSMKGEGELIWKTSVTTNSRVFRIKAEAPAGAKVFILSLERGLTWAPAYAADISGKELDLTSKATIINDLADLDGIDVRLITGFPNLPFVNILDPLAVAQTVDQFTGALMNLGAPSQFRGGGMAMQQNAAARMSDFSQSFDTSGMSGMQAEDLFFYTLPKVDLKQGDRGYFVLFNFKSAYEHVYEWDIADQVQEDQYRPQPQRPQMEDVWHSLKFKNNSKQPLTTAAAITTKDGEILGQDMLFFTNPQQETTLKITKAMDVLAESAEEETSRERKTIAWGGSTNYPFDEITLKGTLSIRNLKAEGIKVKIRKDLTGQIVSADGSPAITKVAKGLRAVNPRQRVEWTVDLKGGEKREVVYVYKVLIRT
jgi:hypothetical protein